MTYLAFVLVLAALYHFRNQLTADGFKLALADGWDSVADDRDDAGEHDNFQTLGARSGMGDRLDDGKPSLCRHKGGGRPRRDRRAERLQRQLMREQLRQARRRIRIPDFHVPPPPPPAAPPPSQTSSDVLDAEQQARRRARRRTNANRGTLFAGETGGYSPGLGGGDTLLG